MISRAGLLLLFAALAPLAGQTLSGEPPDSVRIAAPGPSALMLFPVWTPPEALEHYTTPDTLSLEIPHLKPTNGLPRNQRLVGLGMTVFFGALSYYYNQKAEATYQAYQTSGDPAELDNLFHRTERLDRLAGWCYLGAETGLILVAFSFIIGS